MSAVVKLKEEESIEVLKLLSLINNIKECQMNL